MPVLYTVKITQCVWNLCPCVADSVFQKWTEGIRQQGLPFHSLCTWPNPVIALMSSLRHNDTALAHKAES